ncbi:MAG: HEAT repeat domain-containing protein [Thermoguttaceae bacterium]|jgi:HEAT repeat protein
MWKKNKNIVLAVALLAATAVPSIAQEAKLIAVLKSSATREEKSAACRQLARIATKQSVPALASLLGDEKLSHMARYAMETIRDPSVDDALREALGKLKGRPLLGVIGSLGVRRDVKAVDAIAKLLGGADAGTAKAAARALGNIGTPKAAEALEAALTGASGADQLAICEGLFRCAEALPTEGQGSQSQAIYDRLRGLPQAPPQVRAAALRGAILVRGKAGTPIMLEAVRGSDHALTAAAVRAAMELRGPEVTVALCDELPKLPADKQVLLITTLGYRGDASAGPALLAAASKGRDAVRLAAVQNLTHLGYAPALPLLAELSLAGGSDLAAAARTCLGNFPGKDADGTILAMLAHHDAKVRSLAVQMIGQRNIAGSTATVLKAAEDAEEIVRLAAFKALLHQASAADLPALLEILVKARSSADIEAAENVLIALCSRESKPASGNIVIIKAEYGDPSAGLSADVTKKVAEMAKAGALAIDASNDNFGDPANGHVKTLRVDYSVNGVNASKTVREQETLAITATSTPPAIVDAICAAIQEARGESKLALLRSLRTAHGPKALQSIRAAIADNDPQVKDTALHILCDWPTPDALPLIIDLATAPPTKTIKILALRGLVRLVPQNDALDAKKFDTLKSAMALADRDEERQLVLSALGNVPTTDALALVASHLDNPVLREEACVAAVTIAEKIADRHDARVIAVMKQVAKTTANKDLAARANSIAGQATK